MILVYVGILKGAYCFENNIFFFILYLLWCGTCVDTMSSRKKFEKLDFVYIGVFEC